MAQAAVAQYNLRNFDGAQELFEDLIERDPHRVEVSLCLHLPFALYITAMSIISKFHRMLLAALALVHVHVMSLPLHAVLLSHRTAFCTLCCLVPNHSWPILLP